jgi:hypothetical protein
MTNKLFVLSAELYHEPGTTGSYFTLPFSAAEENKLRALHDRALKIGELAEGSEEVNEL